MSIRKSPEDYLYVRREGQAGAAGILPGHLVLRNAAGEIVVNPTADENPVQKSFADLGVGNAGGETHAYTDNETVNYFIAQPGAYVKARKTAVAMTAGDKLSSNGDGLLQVATGGVGTVGTVVDDVVSGDTFVLIEIV